MAIEPNMSIKDAIIKGAIPVLPAADAAESLKWWTEVCGFKETFRDATPPTYAGINRGEAYLHIAGMNDKILARKVGDQTMVSHCMPNTRSGAARCIPTVRCKPSLGGPRNSGRLTPTVCASRFRSESLGDDVGEGKEEGDFSGISGVGRDCRWCNGV
jgi:hypothetical protein